MDISEESARNWIYIFEEEESDGLADDWRSGRPPKANQAWIETLFDLVHKSLLLFGYPRTGWTLPLLAEVLEDRTGVNLSRGRMRQMLLGTASDSGGRGCGH